MKKHVLLACLLFFGSSVPTRCMLMLQGAPAEAFLALLQQPLSADDIDNNTMRAIGEWLDPNFNVDQYTQLPNIAAQRHFLYNLFPPREKYFKIDEQKYCICMGTNRIPSVYSIDEAGTYERLQDLPDIPQVQPIQEPQINHSTGLLDTLSDTFERVSDRVATIAQSPYFKASCAATIADISTYYIIRWSNKGKKERRHRSPKKWALSTAAIAGLGIFIYS